MASFLNAQNLKPCGTFDHRSKWLKQYQLNPAAYNTKADEILYVPLTIHIVGTDGGTGHYSLPTLLDAFCVLNEDFEESNIQFYIQGDINYLNNSDWYVHATIDEGANMMFTNNVENTINCYFVSDPAGNCGYNLPYAGLAVAKTCAAPNDHTWSHEMGHNMSLPHPFLGWEGGISYDNSINPNFNEAAPDTVLYDYTSFQDVYYTDTLIVDTAVVEKVDGSNCQYAADGFCDTAPDYLAYRWNCGSDSMSLITQHDPDSVAFKSDGTLFMSYASDVCAARFSLEQQAAMRANLIDERPQLLENSVAGEPISTVVPISPINGDNSDYTATVLDWEDMPNAMGYYVKLYIVVGSNTIGVGAYNTTESEVALDLLLNETTYRWTVRPYSNYYTCDGYSSQAEFVTASPSSIKDIKGLEKLSIIPNVITNAVPVINVTFSVNDSKDIDYKVIDISGKTINTGNFTAQVGTNQKHISLETLTKGMYFIVLTDGIGTMQEKFIVQ